jgi:PAS domain S-box-containing protein
VGLVAGGLLRSPDASVSWALAVIASLVLAAVWIFARARRRLPASEACQPALVESARDRHHHGRRREPGPRRRRTLRRPRSEMVGGSNSGEMNDTPAEFDACRASEALRRSAGCFRTIIETSSDIVSIVAADGVLRYVSAAVEPVLGYEPAELIGTDAFALVHPDDLSSTRAQFTLGMTEAGSSGAGVFRLRRRDGSWCIIESVTRNLLDDPDVRGLVYFARDVTARHRAEREVRLIESVENAIAAAPTASRPAPWRSSPYARRSAGPSVRCGRRAPRDRLRACPRLACDGRRPRPLRGGGPNPAAAAPCRPHRPRVVRAPGAGRE